MTINTKIINKQTNDLYISQQKRKKTIVTGLILNMINILTFIYMIYDI